MNYPNSVTEHFFNPKNIGTLSSSETNVGMAHVGSYAAGDVIELSLCIEQDMIKDAKFKAFGNPYIIAGMSLLTTLLIGKTNEEATQITYQDFVKHLSLPPIKLYCALLIEDAIKAALTDYQRKQCLEN
ncbi:MAG: iron-sulfur cluster assembly scaffold protein [Proteobacteria bacterium]|nr:iron-sulfur cluster assembly scaffold protein [Pseudomonadota bacterium]